jgi:hypothetical protein
MAGIRKSTAWFVVRFHEMRPIPPSFRKLPPSLTNLLAQRSELLESFNSPPLEVINLGLPRTR